MKHVTSLLLFWALVGVGLFGQQPKLINYFLSWDKTYPNAQQAVELAKWDVLVLDMENQHLHPEIFPIIRSINPSVKILAYITAQEIKDVINEEGVLRKELKAGIHDSWWLKELNGSGIVFWQGTHMLNGSNQCPRVEGQNWSAYLGQFVSTNVLSNAVWDGVFLDNCWDVLMDTIDKKRIYYDIDNNAEWDDINWRNQEWLIGMDTLMATIRSAHPEKLIVGNGGHTYLHYLNGSLIENFHEWETSWESAMSKYWNIDRNGVKPTLASINAYNRNQGDVKRMRYGLTSCLLGDGYYSFDYGDTDHAQLWWYDEYDAQIGTPLDVAKPLAGVQSAEMLVNTGFEQALTNTWVVDPNTDFGSIHWDNTVAHTGHYSMRCSLKSLPTSDKYHQFTVKQTGFSIQKDSLYKLSFWAKASSPRIMSTMLLKDKSQWGHLFYHLPKVQVGEAWQYFEYFVFINTKDTDIVFPTIPSDTRFSFELGWDLSTLWIDDVSLTKYTPSVWKRAYSNALILCNPTNRAQTVYLDQPYYTVQGNLISTVEGIPAVTLDSRDGVILLKTKPESGLPSRNGDDCLFVYPNPTSGVFYVSSDAIESMQLLTLDGKVLLALKSTGKTNPITLPEWINNGTYVLNIVTQKGIQVVKLLVCKD